jgi:hypothetical protein
LESINTKPDNSPKERVESKIKFAVQKNSI